jgi:hypothetical protein
VCLEIRLPRRRRDGEVARRATSGIDETNIPALKARQNGFRRALKGRGRRVDADQTLHVWLPSRRRSAARNDL